MKLHEATLSMVLGAIVIIIVGVMLVNYFAGRQGETIPPLEVGDEQSAVREHTVTEGEDLWSISEKYYGTGYNWEDVAKANDISDPNQIEAGQKLTIPDVDPKLALGKVTPTIAEEEELITEAPEPSVITSEVKVEEVSGVEEKTYTVQPGDNLWKIADVYYNSGYNWVDIAKENNLNSPYLIEEGQKLSIPDVEIKTVEVASGEIEEPITGETYTVVKDDNLWKIAVRAYADGYKWSEIATENNLLNPNLIHPGNVLTLPR